MLKICDTNEIRGYGMWKILNNKAVRCYLFFFASTGIPRYKDDPNIEFNLKKSVNIFCNHRKCLEVF